jgi:hypothetical protein
LETLAYFSGWVKHVYRPLNNGRLDPGVDFLTKLYDRERLAMRVRRVLDDGPAKNSEDPERTGAGD